MPQNNFFVARSPNPNSALVPMRVDAQGTLLQSGGGLTSVKNITAATVIKAGAGRICRVSVIVAGSAAGTVNDVLTTGAAAVANQVATIPNAVANLDIQFPCATGIVVVPGTGQTLAVSFI